MNPPRSAKGAEPERWAPQGDNRPDARQRQPKSGEHLARRIVEDMLRRKMQAGDLFPPVEAIMAYYQAGRGTVREALRLLESQGVIWMKAGQGGGPVVRETSASDFGHMAELHLRLRGATYDELLAARLSIEPMMANLSARVRDPEGLSVLERVLHEHETVSLDDDLEFQRVTASFHALVATLSGNRVLSLLGESLKEIYQRRVRAALTPLPKRRGICQVHDQIGQAILDGDASLAERLMYEHMLEFAGTVRARYPGILDEVVEWSL